jgi:hypothetical protein
MFSKNCLDMFARFCRKARLTPNSISAVNDPTRVTAWATGCLGGGTWATGGIASDGNDPFVVTRNTFTNPGDPRSDGEAVIRFQSGPIFSGNSSDYWAPPNWQSLVDRLLLEMQIRLGPMATGPLEGKFIRQQAAVTLPAC